MSRGLRLTPEQFASKSFGAKKSKYGNRKKVIDGIEFASTREALRYQDLALMQRAGTIRKLCRQVPYPIYIKGKKICEWLADFVYQEPLDSATDQWRTVVEDSKGCKTPVYRLKKKMVEAEYGIHIFES
jgi:hypothetical protein